jgi:O-antigen/teichoic acid export membrane protein
MGPSWEFPEVSRWLSRGSWAVLDQALFAGSNFVLAIILARWLSQPAFGAYSVAFSALFFIGGLHNPLVMEPAVIFGAGKFKERFASYSKAVYTLHWLAGIVGAVVCLGTSVGLFLLGHAMLGTTFLGLALATPSILYLWLVRRLCYVVTSPSVAVVGGGIFTLTMIPGAFALYQADLLNSASAFLLMGTASLLAGGYIARAIRQRTNPTERTEPFALRLAFAEHWHYGRWSLLSSVFNWVPANVPHLALAAWSGLEASALLRVLLNLITPIQSFNVALSNVLLPAKVEAFQQGRLWPLVTKACGLFALSSLFYWIVLVVSGGWLLTNLFDGKYGSVEVWLWIIGLLPLVSSLSNAISIAFKAMEDPRGLAFSNLLTAGFTLTIGLALQFWFGFTGAVVSLFGASVLFLLCALALLIRRPRTAAVHPIDV